MSLQTKFLSELRAYAKQVFPPITNLQLEDLEHLALYHEAGLCAARGYGKTLIACIYETFMAERNWTVCHCFKNENQAEQWYKWMEILGWVTTLWNARRGQWQVDLRIYKQGRGPRYDVLINDEVGTVCLPLERKHFSACQHMLSGSALGKSVWIGTQDPNSIWSKGKHQRIRGYDPNQMPWVTRAYLAACQRDPQWSIDQEFYCKATPAGGLVLQYVVVDKPTTYTTQRYGIDSNPEEGYCVVGSFHHDKHIYITEAYLFPTLQQLATFVSTHQHMPMELELNGVGMVVKQYLNERDLSVIGTWVDEDTKQYRVTNVACHTIHVPDTMIDTVYPILMKQIWGEDKKIVKFPDAHYFDAFYLSVIEGESYLDPIGGQNMEQQAFDALIENVKYH